MEYKIFSDPHFSHAKMVNEGIRPPGYESIIIKSLYEDVNPSDTVICLGDFSFYNNEQYHNMMNGVNCKRKILVIGNHDRKSINWYLDRGWDFACHNITLKVFGKTVLFSHKPVDVPEDVINVHGHLHNCDWRDNKFDDDRHVLVAMEKSGCKVENLRKLLGV